MKWYAARKEDTAEWAQRMVSQPKEDKKKKKEERVIRESEGLWVSPERKYLPVSEHVMSVGQNPEFFGLSEWDVSALDPKGGGFTEVFKDIIGKGYVRYRYFSDPESTRHLFDVKSYQYAKPVIERILWTKISDGYAMDTDNVSIFQGNGTVFEGKIRDVLEENVSMASVTKKMNKSALNWSAFHRTAKTEVDMNYWVSPDGEEFPAPDASHSGVAAQILEERGTPMDPDKAYQKLLKEGWVRVSMEMFSFSGPKLALIKEFMERHKEFYLPLETVEFDDISKGSFKQVQVSKLLPEAQSEGSHWSFAKRK
jgi:hypothetical protein